MESDLKSLTRMTKKSEVFFVEAETKKSIILLSTAALCAMLGWLTSNSTTLTSIVLLLTVYLLTGDRYHWVYIIVKTARRDLLGLRVILIIGFRIWMWETRGTTVVTRWLEIVKKHPEKKAFIMGNRSFTFQQGEEFSNRIALYFKRQGFKSGEVIGLFMDTRLEYVFIWLGLAKLGITTALINTNLRSSQLVYCLKIAGCRALIFGNEMFDAIKDIQKEIRDTPLFQFNSSVIEVEIIPDAVDLASELKEMTVEPFSYFKAKPRDRLLYIYTSGTTGLPKAAIITNIRFLLIPLGTHVAANFNSSDIIYDPLPLHHTAGGVLGVGQALIMGCTVVLRKKFSASNYWIDAAKYGCTVAQYIGEICRYLLAVPPASFDHNHKIRVVIGNGLRPQIWQEFVNRFGVKKVVEFYGATEGNSSLINLDSKVGAVGFLSRILLSIYPLILVKCNETTGEILRNSEGRCIRCGPGEPGLLLGKIDPKKAILTFSGYADNSATEQKMVRNVRVEGDCYFNSGDLLVMDHFGYFYFKDRTGDTFRWRGENVSTAEVESVISTLVGLKDTIVYGVPIPGVEGKAGMAAIADPERKLDLKVLAAGLKTSLPTYSRPLFVRIMSEPPITATFKLKKKELIEQGFDLGLCREPIFFLDQRFAEYVPLTPTLYDDIVNGHVRL